MGRWDDRLIDQSSYVPSIFFFHNFLQNSLQKSFQLFFYNFTKMKIKSFECPKSVRNYEKKILGTSDAWSTSHLSHQPSELAYYIIDCRISTYLPKNLTSYVNDP